MNLIIINLKVILINNDSCWLMKLFIYIFCVWKLNSNWIFSSSHEREITVINLLCLEIQASIWWKVADLSGRKITEEKSNFLNTSVWKLDHCWFGNEPYIDILPIITLASLELENQQVIRSCSDVCLLRVQKSQENY